MRIAVTGTGGRVGAALARGLSGCHDVIALTRQTLELSDADGLRRGLESLDCDVLVHPAGVTGLEACEDDPELAMAVNAEAARIMAEWAAARGVRLVYFSTDYVLGGQVSGLHGEEELPDPLSVYGRSKLAGERAVLEVPGNLVIRISWVFGPEKPSFVDSIRERALAGLPLSAVCDKFSLPTYTADLVDWVRVLLESNTGGIVHACNSGEPVSWHGLAGAVVDRLMVDGRLEQRPVVLPLKLGEVKDFRATRPMHTAMDTGKLTSVLGRKPRPWNEALDAYLGACDGAAGCGKP